MPPTFTAQSVYDAVRSVDQGMNASIDPLLLERNQLAMFTNGTVRGTFATHRPPYMLRPFVYVDAGIQTVFTTGKFQGAGYYNPDFGPESLIAQISGRLFQVQIIGDTPTVTEIVIPGGSNSATVPQAWMWQAEKWMIINDGVNLPVFYDGNSARRSAGSAAQVATVASPGFTAPAVGAIVTAAFTSAFSGPFNIPLRITNTSGGTSGIFQVVGTGTTFSGYPVTVKNLTQTAGTVEASSSQVTIFQNVIATVATSEFLPGAGTYSFINVTVTADPTFPLNTAGTIQTNAHGRLSGRYTAYNASTKRLTFTLDSTLTTNGADGVPSNSQILANNGNSTLVGLLYSALTAPAVNASTTAYLDRAYTGVVPQTVYINGKQYQITAVGTPVTSTDVQLLNVSATQGASFAANATVINSPELPAGRMGCYGMGRVWMALTDGRSFVAGDIVGGASGSLTYSYRDAVLKMQENTILNGGGSFVVPGQVGDIRAMLFTAVLDTSLGQGPLAVHTPSTVFSCQAPVDRTTWQDLTTPILTEGMKGVGGLGQDSTLLCNSDVIMRSLLGISSYIQSRRDFNVWGNVPMSREVDPIISSDDNDLLQFGSAVQFDNRMLMTTSPVQGALGVYWQKLVALNFDPISSLRGKAPSVYDGIWQDLNILKILKGGFNSTERCFAFCVNTDIGALELWELLPTSTDEFQDSGSDPIVWEYETAELFQSDPRSRPRLCLMNGEIRIDRMDKTMYGVPITEPHTVTIEAFYKPDQWPEWIAWKTVSTSFDPNNGDPGYRPKLVLGEPSAKDTDFTNNRPLREGATFQFKFRVTGHCRIVNTRFKAVTMPEAEFGPVTPSV